jgi:hypothetical protein
VKVPRRRFWMPLIAIALWLGCVHIGLHYHVLGVLRGDAYYRRMPTSYWRDVANHRVERETSPSLLRFIARFTGWRPPAEEPGNPLFKRDPAAQAVLLQLALDPGNNHEVRIRAFEACCGAPLAADDRRAAETCLLDADRALRHEAACLLVRLNGWESALQLLVADCKDDLRAGPSRRHYAEGLLWRVAKDSPSVDIGDLANRLRPMLDDENADIRAAVEYALEVLELARAQRN